MLFAHGGMEVGGGLVLRMRLQTAPVHKQTVAQPAKHAYGKDSLRASNAAEVVMIRDRQSMCRNNDGSGYSGADCGRAGRS